MNNTNVNSSDMENADKTVSVGSEKSSDDTTISHAPLDLGGQSSGIEVPELKVPKQAVQASAGVSEQAAVHLGRITGAKTFFTKLHAGAIEFLDQQIIKWLTENPDVVVKKTNVVTGSIQGKKVEPNIIITVWY